MESLLAKKNDDTCGLLYVATRRSHLREAELSIRALRNVTKRPIALITPFDTDVDVNLISPSSMHHDFRDKVFAILHSPFDRTLYLDTDTLVLRSDFESIFDLLDHFDIAMAHAPGRVRRHVPHIPHCFPEFNSGVVAYRSSTAVREVLERWNSLYASQLAAGIRSDYDTRLGDQAPLREVLYSSTLRIATLPPEYNYRDSCAGRIANAKMIRIIHDRKLQKRSVSQDGVVDWRIVQKWFDQRHRHS